MSAILDQFEACIASNTALPVLNSTQWAQLQVDAQALDAFTQDELLTFCRYKGRGFGVDLSS